MMNCTVLDPYPEPYRLTIDDLDASNVRCSKSSCDTEEHSSNEDDNPKPTIGIVPIRLPYDLPLKKYDFSRDQIWLTDKMFPGQDDFGHFLQP